jgi:xanthosine utilization system XapX-like protein
LAYFYICCAGLSAPFFTCLGSLSFSIAAYVAGGALFVLSLATIWLWGSNGEKHLALWALLLNLLPFFLVSLTRYQREVSQAFVARYGIFTLIGALLLVGTAWRLLASRTPRKTWINALVGIILAVIVGLQIFSLPLWTAKYLEISRAAQKCYAVLNQKGEFGGSITAEDFSKF